MQESLAQSSTEAFHELYAEIPDIKGVALVTMDGLPLVSDLKNSIAADRLAALTASAMSIGKRILPQLNMGQATELTITAEEGKLYLRTVGTSALLCIVAPSTVNLGLLLYKTNQVAQRLTPLLN